MGENYRYNTRGDAHGFRPENAQADRQNNGQVHGYPNDNSNLRDSYRGNNRHNGQTNDQRNNYVNRRANEGDNYVNNDQADRQGNGQSSSQRNANSTWLGNNPANTNESYKGNAQFNQRDNGQTNHQRNSNNGRRNRKAPPTPEDTERRRLQKQENEKRIQEAKDSRIKYQSQWPEIAVGFDPELWRETYRRMHSEALDASIIRLQQLEELTQVEAEDKVFKILMKTTFVEINLLQKGQQTAEELFQSLRLAVNVQNVMPFESVEDLTTFLKSMSPVFIMMKSTKKWRNTGIQSRRFCQYLVERLQLGDVIDDNTFDEVFADFSETIRADNEARLNFARKEFIMDFSSFWILESAVPAFKFDKRTERLSLTSDALPLSLLLPIFADTLHSANPKKRDYSRQMTFLVSQFSIAYPNRATAYGISSNVEELNATIFRSKFEKTTAMDKRLMTVTAFVSPNNLPEQFETMRAEPTRLDFTNNFASIKGGTYIDSKGAMSGVTFDQFEQHFNTCRKNTFRHSKYSS